MKPTQTCKTYLGLGDSMSIDAYTGVTGGGAIAQFYRRLCERPRTNGDAAGWQLVDRSGDGYRMADIRFDGPADIITMTVGGNDLLQNMHRDPAEFIPEFARGYARLSMAIHKAHPNAIVIVGNIYRPQMDSGVARQDELDAGLAEANRVIGLYARLRRFRLADIHGAFLGHEDEYLCYSIEPTLAGASAIAGLFDQAANQ